MEERVVSKDEEDHPVLVDLMAPFILTMPPGAMNRAAGVYSTFHPGAQRAAFGERRRAREGFPEERFGKPVVELLPLAWPRAGPGPGDKVADFATAKLDLKDFYFSCMRIARMAIRCSRRSRHL